jgi:Rod binding domain-containing protein
MNVGNAITDLPGLISEPPSGSSSAKDKQKQLGAAQDFEALLLGQMLHSIREEGSGWLGTGDDDASATAFGFGEDQLAKALTQGGGLGLAKMIAAGLAAKSAEPESGKQPGGL